MKAGISLLASFKLLRELTLKVALLGTFQYLHCMYINELTVSITGIKMQAITTVPSPPDTWRCIGEKMLSLNLLCFLIVQLGSTLD